MKTIIKNAVTIVLFIAATLFVGSSCNNDNNEPNDENCTFQGFKSDLAMPFDEITEANLFTDFFYTSSNGPEVEIYDRNNPGDFNFTTTTVTLNGTGSGTLNYGGNTYAVSVVCTKTGAAVGDEMQFTITGTGFTGKFCVIVDSYH